MEEARLSTFLAADKDNTDDAPEAFLSGAIVDAQSRYNLRNIANLTDPILIESETVMLAKLLDNIGVNGSDVGPRVANAMRAAFNSTTSPTTNGSTTGTATTTTTTTPTTVAAAASTYLQPQTIDQLAWFGVDDDTITRMTPYFTILPISTKVNINTAPKEVLAAAAGIEMGMAQQWIQRRAGGKPFKDLGPSITAISPGLPAATQTNIANRLDFKSSYFEGPRPAAAVRPGARRNLAGQSRLDPQGHDDPSTPTKPARSHQLTGRGHTQGLFASDRSSHCFAST